MFVISGSETVVTYELRPHRLALCTRGLGCLGLTPILEKVVCNFFDFWLFILDLLLGFVLLHNCILHPGFPTGQGFAHLPKGPFVYLVPSEVCVIVRVRALVSSVQLVEKELTIMIVVTPPWVYCGDRDG